MNQLSTPAHSVVVNNSNVFQPLALQSMFWRPAYLQSSAWFEHIPFAFWLIEAHRPRVFVELGSHYGTSYFAFCQAVERLGYETQCYAVDTWKGDKHAGLYDEGVYNQVKAYNDAQYSGFSRLVRSTFDEAVDHFTDGSIDLLHIDGLHTLEAVTHDVDLWLPKLSERGVMIMHDTNVRERGFGVFKVFESLKSKYPTFEFTHGHGLGIIGVGLQQNELVHRLLRASENEATCRSIQEVFSRLGRACADAFALKQANTRADRLADESTRYKTELSTYKTTLDETEGKLTRFQEELRQTKQQLEKSIDLHAVERGQLIERANLYQELRVELKAELTALQEKSGYLTTDLLRRSAEYAALETAFAAQQRQLDSMSEAHRRTDLLTDELTRENADLHTQIAALRKLEDANTAEIAQWKESHSSSVERDKEASAFAMQLQTALTDATQQIQELKVELAAAAAERAQLDDQCRNGLEQLALREAELAALRDSAARLEGTVNAVRAEQIATKEELQRAEQSLVEAENEKSALQTEISDGATTRAALTAELVARTSECADEARRAVGLSKELEERTNELTQKRLELVQVGAERDAARSDAIDLKAEIEKFEARHLSDLERIRVLSEQISDLEQEQAETELQLAAVKEKAEISADELATLTLTLTQERSTLAREAARAKRLEHEHLTAQADAAAKTEQCNELQEKHRSALADMAVERSRSDNLEAQVRSLEEQARQTAKSAAETLSQVKAELSACTVDLANKTQTAERITKANLALQANADGLTAQIRVLESTGRQQVSDIATLALSLREANEARAKEQAEQKRELQELNNRLAGITADLIAAANASDVRDARYQEMARVLASHVADAAGLTPGKRKRPSKALDSKALLELSGLFDEAWYRAKYSDLLSDVEDAVDHYMEHGVAHALDPGPLFSGAAYLTDHPDVKAVGLNPLLHYLHFGYREGRIIKIASK